MPTTASGSCAGWDPGHAGHGDGKVAAARLANELGMLLGYMEAAWYDASGGVPDDLLFSQCSQEVMLERMRREAATAIMKKAFHHERNRQFQETCKQQPDPEPAQPQFRLRYYSPSASTERERTAKQSLPSEGPTTTATSTTSADSSLSLANPANDRHQHGSPTIGYRAPKPSPESDRAHPVIMPSNPSEIDALPSTGMPVLPTIASSASDSDSEPVPMSPPLPSVAVEPVIKAPEPKLAWWETCNSQQQPELEALPNRDYAADGEDHLRTSQQDESFDKPPSPRSEIADEPQTRFISRELSPEANQLGQREEGQRPRGAFRQEGASPASEGALETPRRERSGEEEGNPGGREPGASGGLTSQPAADSPQQRRPSSTQPTPISGSDNGRETPPATPSEPAFPRFSDGGTTIDERSLQKNTRQSCDEPTSPLSSGDSAGRIAGNEALGGGSSPAASDGVFVLKTTRTTHERNSLPCLQGTTKANGLHQYCTVTDGDPSSTAQHPRMQKHVANRRAPLQNGGDASSPESGSEIESRERTSPPAVELRSEPSDIDTTRRVERVAECDTNGATAYLKSDMSPVGSDDSARAAKRSHRDLRSRSVGQQASGLHEQYLTDCDASAVQDRRLPQRASDGVASLQGGIDVSHQRPSGKTSDQRDRNIETTYHKCSSSPGASEDSAPANLRIHHRTLQDRPVNQWAHGEDGSECIEEARCSGIWRCDGYPSAPALASGTKRVASREAERAQLLHCDEGSATCFDDEPSDGGKSTYAADTQVRARTSEAGEAPLQDDASGRVPLGAKHSKICSPPSTAQYYTQRGAVSGGHAVLQPTPVSSSFASSAASSPVLNYVSQTHSFHSSACSAEDDEFERATNSSCGFVEHLPVTPILNVACPAHVAKPYVTQRSQAEEPVFNTRDTLSHHRSILQYSRGGLRVRRELQEVTNAIPAFEKATSAPLQPASGRVPRRETSKPHTAAGQGHEQEHGQRQADHLVASRCTSDLSHASRILQYEQQFRPDFLPSRRPEATGTHGTHGETDLPDADCYSFFAKASPGIRKHRLFPEDPDPSILAHPVPDSRDEKVRPVPLADAPTELTPASRTAQAAGGGGMVGKKVSPSGSWRRDAAVPATGRSTAKFAKERPAAVAAARGAVRCPQELQRRDAARDPSDWSVGGGSEPLTVSDLRVASRCLPDWQSTSEAGVVGGAYIPEINPVVHNGDGLASSECLLCDAGHPLKLVSVGKGAGKSGYASHRCNLCGVAGLTTVIYRCQLCDFDMCIACPGSQEDSPGDFTMRSPGDDYVNQDVPSSMIRRTEPQLQRVYDDL
ncbi:hypothetical protein DIPPA_12942 [Diplonema papillatum]|nr:hypothetical protein DIPPA_12942 [Diplonema papillatum]